MMPQYSAISEHSTLRGSPKAIRDWLMSLAPDSLVNRSVLPANEPEKPIREICGRRRSEAFAEYDQNTRFWKTFQASLLPDISEEYLETWPKCGIALDGVVFRLPDAEPPIFAKEYGYWLTPQGSDGEGGIMKMGRKGRYKLRDQVDPRNRQFWPTPRANEVGGISSPLEQCVKMFPTPKCRDAKGQTQRGIHRQADGLANLDDGTGRCLGGRLSPMWVEWLMGWPIAWTDLKPLVMDKYRQWRQKHLDT